MIKWLTKLKVTKHNYWKHTMKAAVNNDDLDIVKWVLSNTQFCDELHEVEEPNNSNRKVTKWINQQL